MKTRIYEILWFLFVRFAMIIALWFCVRSASGKSSTAWAVVIVTMLLAPESKIGRHRA